MKRILYIEDNTDTAAAVQLILSGAGYQVVTAFDGESGIAKAKDDSFDLILLDVMLPDMSGWDIFAKLKGKLRARYAFLSAIPISVERMTQLGKEGVADYITKPFAKADLIVRVGRILA